MHSKSSKTSSIDRLKQSLPDTVQLLSRCRENSCGASVTYAKKLIVKGESLTLDSEKASDCVFFVEQTRDALGIVLAELKKKSYSVNDIIDKMRSTESRALQLIQDASIDVSGVRRYVVAGSHPRTSTPEYYLLVKRGGINLRKCGETLE